MIFSGSDVEFLVRQITSNETEIPTEAQLRSISDAIAKKPDSRGTILEILDERLFKENTSWPRISYFTLDVYKSLLVLEYLLKNVKEDMYSVYYKQFIKEIERLQITTFPHGNRPEAQEMIVKVVKSVLRILSPSSKAHRKESSRPSSSAKELSSPVKISPLIRLMTSLHKDKSTNC